MVQKFYCERYLSIQSMLGKKEKNTNISIFSTTPTYLKHTFVCFFSFFFYEPFPDLVFLYFHNSKSSVQVQNHHCLLGLVVTPLFQRMMMTALMCERSSPSYEHVYTVHVYTVWTQHWGVLWTEPQMPYHRSQNLLDQRWHCESDKEQLWIQIVCPLSKILHYFSTPPLWNFPLPPIKCERGADPAKLWYTTLPLWIWALVVSCNLYFAVVVSLSDVKTTLFEAVNLWLHVTTSWAVLFQSVCV